mgnify:CR=1 FL=1
MTTSKTTTTAMRMNKNDDAYRHDAVGELERKLDEAHDECAQLETALEKAVNELESTQRERDKLKKKLNGKNWRSYLVAACLAAALPIALFSADWKQALGGGGLLLALLFGTISLVKAITASEQ